MKTPTDCESLSDAREAIDHVDRQMIALLGLRADYVRSAARFKTSKSAVADPDRIADMLEARRRWAESEKLDPDFVEGLYLTYFLAHERNHWWG